MSVTSVVKLGIVSSSDRMIVAIEAPSDSGKSTLVSALMTHFGEEDSALLPCYVDVAGGDGHVPAQRAQTAFEQRESLQAFLGLEAQRLQVADEAMARARVLLLDRSVYSLLAHAYAEEQTGGPAAFRDCCQLVREFEPVLWPDLVLFLDVSEENRRARTAPGDEGKWFADAPFNRAFSEYFLDDVAKLGNELAILDADVSREDVLRQAVARIGITMATE